MCGRFGLATSGEDLALLLDLARVPVLRPRYNIAPTQKVLVLRDGGGGRELVELRWGLVPSWARDERIGQRLINARAETAADKPAFRSAVRRRRCLVPADGFYEWRGAGKDRQPFHVGLRGGEPFTIAALWERWRGPGQRSLESCALLTTAANALVRPVHDRMPVIVPASLRGAWLDPASDGMEALAAVARAFPAEAMERWPVSRRVNDARAEGPACRAPVDGLTGAPDGGLGGPLTGQGHLAL